MMRGYKRGAVLPQFLAVSLLSAMGSGCSTSVEGARFPTLTSSYNNAHMTGADDKVSPVMLAHTLGHRAARNMAVHNPHFKGLLPSEMGCTELPETAEERQAAYAAHIADFFEDLLIDPYIYDRLSSPEVTAEQRQQLSEYITERYFIEFNRFLTSDMLREKVLESFREYELRMMTAQAPSVAQDDTFYVSARDFEDFYYFKDYEVYKALADMYGRLTEIRNCYLDYTIAAVTDENEMALKERWGYIAYRLNSSPADTAIDRRRRPPIVPSAPMY